MFLAVAAYWSYAAWAHTQVHLLISVIAAPLLLLRSEHSLKDGVRYFNSFESWLWNRTESFGLNEEYSRYRFDKHFLGAMLYTLGLVYAFGIRVFSTAKHPMAGIASFASNWWRTLFCTDLVTPPEIVPGYRRESSAYLVSEAQEQVAAIIKNEATQGGFAKLIFLPILVIGAFLILLISYGPAYLYRLSIKSSAWAHWPIVYIARPLTYADDAEEVHLRLWADPREWARRLLMIITLSGTAIASFQDLARLRAIFPEGVSSFVEYAFVIDFQSLLAQPWRVVALISAGITLFLTWYGWELYILVRRSKLKPERKPRAATWAALLEYLMRVRDLCGWVFWALVVVHASLWLMRSTSWITGYPQEILQTIYGNFLPPALRK